MDPAKPAEALVHRSLRASPTIQPSAREENPSPQEPVVLKPRQAPSVTRATLVKHLRGRHAEVLEIFQQAKAAGRHETALRAHKEVRADCELIARIEGIMRDGDLCRNNFPPGLTAEQFGDAIRASFRVLPIPDREELLLSEPSLIEFIDPDEFGIASAKPSIPPSESDSD